MPKKKNEEFTPKNGKFSGEKGVYRGAKFKVLKQIDKMLYEVEALENGLVLPSTEGSGKEGALVKGEIGTLATHTIGRALFGEAYSGGGRSKRKATKVRDVSSKVSNENKDSIKDAILRAILDKVV